MGSIICDYHGKVITGAEGWKLVESIKGDTAYLFFFQAAGRDLCVDAETFPCECHPTENTMGRMINHSSKRANLRPVHCMMNFPEGQRDVILFQAKRDIHLCEELLFDYTASSANLFEEKQWSLTGWMSEHIRPFIHQSAPSHQGQDWWTIRTTNIFAIWKNIYTARCLHIFDTVFNFIMYITDNKDYILCTKTANHFLEASWSETEIQHSAIKKGDF